MRAVVQLYTDADTSRELLEPCPMMLVRTRYAMRLSGFREEGTDVGKRKDGLLLP